MNQTVFEKILRAGLINANISPEQASNGTAPTTGKVIPTPIELINSCDISAAGIETIRKGRQEIQEILAGKDRRKIILLGPCSVRNPEEMLEFARPFAALQNEVRDELFLVLRAYLEKPRTILTRQAWKGYVYDPFKDGSDELVLGLKESRKLYIRLNEMGIPIAAEFLISPIAQRLGDLVSYVAVGARNSGAQYYRERASGTSMPIGWKNDLYGMIREPINSILSMAEPQSFLDEDYFGRMALHHTEGNRTGHLILRGGDGSPNYHYETVERTIAKVKPLGGSHSGIVIDSSHENSEKDYTRQQMVFRDVIQQMCLERRLFLSGSLPRQYRIGVMLEADINAGRQELKIGATNPSEIKYGVSVTDGCISREEAIELVRYAAGELRRCK